MADREYDDGEDGEDDLGAGAAPAQVDDTGDAADEAGGAESGGSGTRRDTGVARNVRDTELRRALGVAPEGASQSDAAGSVTAADNAEGGAARSAEHGQDARATDARATFAAAPFHAVLSPQPLEGETREAFAARREKLAGLGVLGPGELARTPEELAGQQKQAERVGAGLEESLSRGDRATAAAEVKAAKSAAVDARREAAGAAKAAKGEAAARAKFLKGQGVEMTVDPQSGAAVPATHADGRLKFKRAFVGDVYVDDTGRAVKDFRDEFGRVNAVDLEGNGDVHVDAQTGERYVRGKDGLRVNLGQDENAVKRAELGEKLAGLREAHGLEVEGIRQARTALAPVTEAWRAADAKMRPAAKILEKQEQAYARLAAIAPNDPAVASQKAALDKMKAQVEAQRPAWAAAKSAFEGQTKSIREREVANDEREKEALRASADLARVRAAKYLRKPAQGGGNGTPGGGDAGEEGNADDAQDTHGQDARATVEERARRAVEQGRTEYEAARAAHADLVKGVRLAGSAAPGTVDEAGGKALSEAEAGASSALEESGTRVKEAAARVVATGKVLDDMDAARGEYEEASKTAAPALERVQTQMEQVQARAAMGEISEEEAGRRMSELQKSRAAAMAPMTSAADKRKAAVEKLGTMFEDPEQWQVNPERGAALDEVERAGQEYADSAGPGTSVGEGMLRALESVKKVTDKVDGRAVDGEIAALRAALKGSRGQASDNTDDAHGRDARATAPLDRVDRLLSTVSKVRGDERTRGAELEKALNESASDLVAARDGGKEGSYFHYLSGQNAVRSTGEAMHSAAESLVAKDAAGKPTGEKVAWYNPKWVLGLMKIPLAGLYRAGQGALGMRVQDVVRQDAARQAHDLIGTLDVPGVKQMLSAMPALEKRWREERTVLTPEQWAAADKAHAAGWTSAAGVRTGFLNRNFTLAGAESLVHALEDPGPVGEKIRAQMAVLTDSAKGGALPWMVGKIDIDEKDPLQVAQRAMIAGKLAEAQEKYAGLSQGVGEAVGMAGSFVVPGRLAGVAAQMRQAGMLAKLTKAGVPAAEAAERAAKAGAVMHDLVLAGTAEAQETLKRNPQDMGVVNRLMDVAGGGAQLTLGLKLGGKFGQYLEKKLGGLVPQAVPRSVFKFGTKAVGDLGGLTAQGMAQSAMEGRDPTEGMQKMLWQNGGTGVAMAAIGALADAKARRIGGKPVAGAWETAHAKMDEALRGLDAARSAGSGQAGDAAAVAKANDAVREAQTKLDELTRVALSVSPKTTRVLAGYLGAGARSIEDAMEPGTDLARVGLGRQLRGVYLPGVKADGARRVAGLETDFDGDAEGMAQAVVDAHVGAVVAKDLAGIADGSATVAPDKLAALARLGLVVPGGVDPSGKVSVHLTGDGVAFLPGEMRSRVQAEPGKYRVSVSPGENGAGWSQMHDEGRGVLAQAVGRVTRGQAEVLRDVVEQQRAGAHGSEAGGEQEQETGNHGQDARATATAGDRRWKVIVEGEHARGKTSAEYHETAADEETAIAQARRKVDRLGDGRRFTGATAEDLGPVEGAVSAASGAGGLPAKGAEGTEGEGGKGGPGASEDTSTVETKEGARGESSAAGGAGQENGGDWMHFAPEAGGLGIPRVEMPQVKAEHRGALANFLRARGIEWEDATVRAGDLKPAQAEFSPGKVSKAIEYSAGKVGPERKILVSEDGHVIDGHHQWMAKLQEGADTPMEVVRLKAPVKDILREVAEFPSVERAEGKGSNPEDEAASQQVRAGRAEGAGAEGAAGGGEVAGAERGAEHGRDARATEARATEVKVPVPAGMRVPVGFEKEAEGLRAEGVDWFEDPQAKKFTAQPMADGRVRIRVPVAGVPAVRVWGETQYPLVKRGVASFREELKHAAGLLAQRAEWEKLGKPGNFVQFTKMRTAEIWSDTIERVMGLPEGPERQAIEDGLVGAYNAYVGKEGDAGPAVKSFGELLRVLDGRASEAGTELTEGASAKKAVITPYQMVWETARMLADLRLDGKITEETGGKFVRLVKWVKESLVALGRLGKAFATGSLQGSEMDRLVEETVRGYEPLIGKFGPLDKLGVNAAHSEVGEKTISAETSREGATGARERDEGRPAPESSAEPAAPAGAAERIREDLPEAKPIRAEIEALVARAEERHAQMAPGQTKDLTHPSDLLTAEEKEQLHAFATLRAALRADDNLGFDHGHDAISGMLSEARPWETWDMSPATVRAWEDYLDARKREGHPVPGLGEKLRAVRQYLAEVGQEAGHEARGGANETTVVWKPDWSSVEEPNRQAFSDVNRVSEINGRLSELARVMERTQGAWQGSRREYLTQEGRDAAAEYERLLSERHAINQRQGQGRATLPRRDMRAPGDSEEAASRDRARKMAEAEDVRQAEADYEGRKLWKRLLEEKDAPVTEGLGKVWAEASKGDELFRYPKTDAKHPGDIGRAMSVPGEEIKGAVINDGEQVEFYKIGKDGKIEGDLTINHTDSNRPTIYAAGANSRGKERGGGAQMYQAALTWAHNNGRTIYASGALSDINRVRRTSNMLSNALRTGSTVHMKPDAAQGVREWRDGPGQEGWNIGQLARREMENVQAAMPWVSGLTYDFSSGKIRDNDGREISRRELSSRLKSDDPEFRKGIGDSTAARAIVTASALRELHAGEGGGVSAGAGERGTGRVGGLGEGIAKHGAAEGGGELLYSSLPIDSERGGGQGDGMPDEKRAARDSTGQPLPLRGREAEAMDRAYGKAVASGDLQKARRLVEAARKRAGLVSGDSIERQWVHISNLREQPGGNEVDPSRDFSGWILPAQTTEQGHANAMETKFAKPGAVAVLVPEEFAQTGRVGAPKIKPGFRPSAEQVKTIGAEHVRANGTVDFVKLFTGKSADVVERDETGRVVPVSERFGFSGQAPEAGAELHSSLPLDRTQIAEETKGIENPVEVERPEFEKRGVFGALKDWWTRLARGRKDVLEYFAPGTSKVLEAGEVEGAKVRAGLREMMEKMTGEVKKGLGAADGMTAKARRKRFVAELLPTAARLNAFDRDFDGNLEFSPFDMRAGVLSEKAAKKMGIGPGEIYEQRGEFLKVGEYLADQKAFQLLRPMSADRQQAIYEDFHRKYPEMAHYLDLWIDPKSSKARVTDERGTVLPEFNRGALRDFFGEVSPHGELGDVKGYVPEVARTRSLAGMIGSAVTNLLSKSWTSGAREYKTGGAREAGRVRDLFQGFAIRAMEAHAEAQRVRMAERLLPLAVKQIPTMGVPDGWVAVNPNALATLADSFGAAQGMNEEQLRKFTAAVTNGDQEALKKLVGSAWASIAGRKMMRKEVFAEMVRPLADRQVRNTFLKVINSLSKSYTGGLLSHPFSALQNQFSNEIFKMMRVGQRALYSLAVLPFNRRESKLARREAWNLASGLITDRWYHAKQMEAVVPPEMFEGNTSIAGAVQSMTDEGMTAWEHLKQANVPQAILQAVRYGKMDTRAKQQLAYASYMAQASVAADDAVREKGLVFRTKEQRTAWMKKWLANAPEDVHRRARAVAMAYAMDYANVPWWMDDSHQIKVGGMDVTGGVNTLRRLTLPFIKWPYNMLRQMKRFAGDSTVDIFSWLAGRALAKVPGIKGTRVGDAMAGWAKSRRVGGERLANGVAHLGTLAMMYGVTRALLGLGGDDKNLREKLGRSFDEMGKRLDPEFETSSRVNLRGTILDGPVRALAKMFGDEEGKSDYWMRTRTLPYLSPMLALAGTEAWARGKMDAADMGQAWREFVADYQSEGVLLQIFNTLGGREDKYSAGQPVSTSVGGDLFDLATSRIAPPPLMQAARDFADPTGRRLNPSKALNYNPGFAEGVKSRIPVLSRSLPPRGRVVTQSLENETTAPALGQLAAMGEPKASRISVNDKGNAVASFVDPDTIPKVPRWKTGLRFAGLNVKPVDKEGYGRAVAGEENEFNKWMRKLKRGK